MLGYYPPSAVLLELDSFTGIYDEKIVIRSLQDAAEVAGGTVALSCIITKDIKKVRHGCLFVTPII